MTDTNASEKLDMASPDLVSKNIEQIAALFPNCVTETAEGKRIDFDLLKQELSHDIVEGNKERYRLEWPGKREAIVTANLPTTKTLRPVPEESVNFDTTENLYIEGDNLEVLKLLQESYLGKVKMIYIDPPYNTGNDLVYKDDFKQSTDEFSAENGFVDEYNRRLIPNSDTSGRYHSDWLSMMYPRLKLAKALMANDATIFISIDDHEAHNLKKMMDEIFGEKNFISDITVVNNLKGRNDKKYIATANEKLFMYVKTDEFQENGLSLPDDKIETYNENDQGGSYRLIELRKRGGADTRQERPNMYYPIFVDPETGKVSLEKKGPYSIEALPKKSTGIDGRWRWGIDKTRLGIKTLVGKPVQGTSKYNIYEKDYIEQDGELRRIKPKSVMAGSAYSTDVATKKYRAVMGSVDFTNPKPVELLSDLIEYSALKDSNAIVLDFFSGSGTTGNAVFELNSKDNGNRKFILVQLPELTSPDSYAANNGFDNICDIAKERLRRVGLSLAEQNPQIDHGFRVYRLDDSNMQDVYYRPQEMNQQNLDMFADNIKLDRTPEDLVTQIMLDWGLPLSLPFGRMQLQGKEVIQVAGNSLFACFDSGIDEAFAREMAIHKPLRIVFRDRSFANDTAKENVRQLLKQLSPSTEMRVL